jgi:hypothetical protein
VFALTIQGGLAASGPPDVRAVPTQAGGTVKTPLVNTFHMSWADPSTAAQKVFLGGVPACHLRTMFPMSAGGERCPGVGVVSGSLLGPGRFSPAAGDRKVLVENMPAVAMGAQTLHNGDARFNTTGVCPLAAQSSVALEP